MKRFGVTGIRMAVAVQLFTTGLVVFTGILAVELGSSYLNQIMGFQAFPTYNQHLKALLGISHAEKVPQDQTSAPLFQVKMALYRMRLVILLGGLVASLAGWALYMGIRRPIKDLMAGVRSVAQGDYRALVTAHTSDEFAPLVEAFNKMVDAVHRSQERLTKVFLAADDAILSTDTEDRVQLWGGGSERLFGYSVQEAPGIDLKQLLAQDVHPGSLREIKLEAASRGRCESELRFRSKDGRTFDGWCVSTHLKDDRGSITGYLHVIRDVTEKKMMELQMIQSEKMASMGELAAGVAHEINNPLTGIMTNAEFLQEEIPLEETERHEEIRQIIMNSQRIRIIVRDLLNFARQKDAELMAPVNIASVLAASLNLTGHQMELDNIIVNKEVPEDLPPVWGSANRIEQVFINILSNARHALNEKFKGSHPDKRLEIRAEVVRQDGRPMLRTEFKDYGIGIPGNLLEKVFSPFFTTKEQGKGTGLGMSISHHIVQEHGGFLKLESKEGEYTKVMVDLPINTEGEDG